MGGRDKKTPSITDGVSVKKGADYTKAGRHLISFGATINIIYLIQYQVNKSMKLA